MNLDVVYQMYLSLNEDEKNEFLNRLNNTEIQLNSNDDFISIVLEHSNNPLPDRLSCPHCQSHKVVKNGFDKGIQRFKCKDCKKSFTWSNNTILYGSKKPFNAWKTFCECVMNKFPLRKCASICKINLHTAFNWRHKVLDALQNMHNSVVLNGIVESDETYFNLSLKGLRNLNRLPHERGSSNHVRGLSKEIVCVPCSVNLNGLSIGRITNLGKPSYNNLMNFYNNRIVEGSIFVTDSLNSYDPISHNMNLTHVKIPTGRFTNGQFNIQRINSYHSELKNLTNFHFRGVATKYLNNYVVYHNFVNIAKETFSEKLEILKDFVFSTVCNTRGYKIVFRNSVPV